MLEASRFERIEWQMRDHDISCTSDINSRSHLNLGLRHATTSRPRPMPNHVLAYMNDRRPTILYMCSYLGGYLRIVTQVAGWSELNLERDRYGSTGAGRRRTLKVNSALISVQVSIMRHCTRGPLGKCLLKILLSDILICK